MYTQLYKKCLFPLYVRGIQRRRTLQYLAELDASQWNSAEEIQQIQLQRLRTLLQSASLECEYYAVKWRELGLPFANLGSLADLRQWPVLRREDVTRHFTGLCAATKVRKTVSSTGGSTGEPMPFAFDAEAAQRRAAATYRGYGWAGVEPGMRRLELWGTDLARPTLARQIKKTLVNSVKRNRTLSCFNLTPERMRNYANVLDRYRPHVIVAYSQALFEFARFLDAERLTPYSPATIVVGAEPIYEFQRNLIERVFRAPVFETYGCRELLLIAAQCERREGLHLSSEHLIVEILDEDGNPAAAGDEGEIVITDLTNHSMPLIRYANGDRALAGLQACSCGRGLPLLRQLRGRTADTITTPDGRNINGLFFPHLIKDFPAIRQFQVVQTSSDSLALNFVSDDELPGDERRKLLGQIQETMGPSMHVEARRVRYISLTSSGKLRPVMRHAER